MCANLFAMYWIFTRLALSGMLRINSPRFTFLALSTRCGKSVFHSLHGIARILQTRVGSESISLARLLQPRPLQISTAPLGKEQHPKFACIRKGSQELNGKIFRKRGSDKPNFQGVQRNPLCKRAFPRNVRTDSLRRNFIHSGYMSPSFEILVEILCEEERMITFNASFFSSFILHVVMQAGTCCFAVSLCTRIGALLFR
jgi:hypothetical protein